MARKPHISDIEFQQAYDRADCYIVSLFLGTGKYDKRPAPDLETARAYGDEMEKAHQNGRKKMVYAISPEGVSMIIPDDFVPETKLLETDMIKTETESNVTPIETVSAPYTTRFNCTRAMTKSAMKAGLPVSDYEITGGNGRYVFRLKQQPKPVAVKTAKPAPKADAPAPATSGTKARYDWRGADDRAKQGTLPPKPDFSANTHARYRGKLNEVEALANAGNLADLEKMAKTMPTYDSSVLAISKYAGLCIKALKARSKIAA